MRLFRRETDTKKTARCQSASIHTVMCNLVRSVAAVDSEPPSRQAGPGLGRATTSPSGCVSACSARAHKKSLPSGFRRPDCDRITCDRQLPHFADNGCRRWNRRGC